MNSRKQTPLKIEVRESADIFEVRASAATQEKNSFLAVDTLVMSVLPYFVYVQYCLDFEELFGCRPFRYNILSRAQFPVCSLAGRGRRP